MMPKPKPRRRYQPSKPVSRPVRTQRMKINHEFKTNSAIVIMCAPPITNRRYSRLPVGATGGFARHNENRWFLFISQRLYRTQARGFYSRKNPGQNPDQHAATKGYGHRSASDDR